MKNVCIVGYGSIGPIHADAVSKTQNGRVFAVCDIRKDRAEECHNKYGARMYFDFDEMLADEEIDTVHICTPHYLHYEMSKKALAAGKYVLCEKPVAMTQSEFEQLMRLPQKDRICVVMQTRLNPCVKKMKELVDSKEFGNIKALKATLTWNRSAEYYAQDAWRGKWKTEGGGVLINQAIHTLDNMHYVAGRVNRVQAHMTNFSLPDVIEVEDTVVARMNFEIGVTGILFATNSYGDSTSPEIEVLLEKGRVRYRAGKLYINDKLVEEDPNPTVGKTVWGKGHERLMHLYYDQDYHYLSPTDVKDTMETMFAIYKSAKLNGDAIII